MLLTSPRISGRVDADAAMGIFCRSCSDLHAVLRRLHRHVVAHAVLRAQPESGLRLKAAAQRHQHGVGDVLFA